MKDTLTIFVILNQIAKKNLLLLHSVSVDIQTKIQSRMSIHLTVYIELKSVLFFNNTKEK